MPKQKGLELDRTCGISSIRYIVRYINCNSYETIAVTKDGTLLCSSCVQENYKQIFRATKESDDPQWEVTTLCCENELEDCQCANCNRSLGYSTMD